MKRCMYCGAMPASATTYEGYAVYCPFCGPEKGTGEAPTLEASWLDWDSKQQELLVPLPPNYEAYEELFNTFMQKGMTLEEIKLALRGHDEGVN